MALEKLVRNVKEGITNFGFYWVPLGIGCSLAGAGLIKSLTDKHYDWAGFFGVLTIGVTATIYSFYKIANSPIKR